MKKKKLMNFKKIRAIKFVIISDGTMKKGIQKKEL